MKLISVVLLSAVMAAAQTHQHAPPENKKVDLAKLPAPEKIAGVGQAHIPITTKSPEAQRPDVQQWFDQGLALLHCFWDYEALRAFEQAARLDPDCAMCHWGLFQALDFLGVHEQAKAELTRAYELAAKATDREQRYIRANFEQQSKRGDEATQAFIHEMEALQAHYPDDLQAKIMLVAGLIGGFDKNGDPYPNTLYTQSMLRNLLREYPDNAAINHYWIHSVESSDHPEWALESAEKLGQLAPASGHVVHMPGHIFYRMGDYDRAREIFLQAERVDQEYMARQHVSVADDWNYAHNLSYLIADCAEAGRYQEAIAVAAKLQGLADDPDATTNPGFFILQIGSSAARLALRFGRWDDAIGRPMNFGVPDAKLGPAARGYRDGLVAYARGMKAAESGASDEANRQSAALDALLWRLSEEKSDDDEARGIRDRVVKILGTASLDLRASLATGDEAKHLFDQAIDHEKDLGYSEPPSYARPEQESLGHALIRAKKYSEARDAFAKELHERPKSGFALYGIALAWDREGKREEAAKSYREFLDAWRHADRDLPQIKAAR